MADTVEDYLAALPEPHRSTLQTVRRRIREILPDAVEAMSYGCPAFKVRGRNVAGFAAFARHLTYLPHSPAVLSALAGELSGFQVSKGAFRFAVDQPLDAALLRRLIETRLAEVS